MKSFLWFLHLVPVRPLVPKEHPHIEKRASETGWRLPPATCPSYLNTLSHKLSLLLSKTCSWTNSLKM